MSMHKVQLTDLEREGLALHHMPVGSPSQLSDAFRLGMLWYGNNNPLAARVAELEQQLKSKADDITSASRSAYNSGIVMGKAIAYDELKGYDQ